MGLILIGIDDTDNDTSPGTGHLARQVLGRCVELGMRSRGITRHQFLLDAAIPYTSHNSGACVAVECDSGVAEVGFVFHFVARAAAEGSDPGVCVACQQEVGDDVVAFAHRVTAEVVAIREAFAAAREAGLKLYGLGGDCQGVIGALASVGLRAEGDDGRFIDLPGLREFKGCVGIEAYDRLGIAVEHKNGPEPGRDDVYDTLGWVRPRLVGGRAVLIVEWSEQNNAWIPVDRKKSRPLE